MLQIRQEQMQAMHQSMLEQFEEKMLGHLKQYLPKKVEEFGEKQTCELIHQGMDIAASHQITMERDVAKYIDLMFIIRPDFDTNPATKWASAILAELEQPAPRRLSRVQREAGNYGFSAPVGEEA